MGDGEGDREGGVGWTEWGILEWAGLWWEWGGAGPGSLQIKCSHARPLIVLRKTGRATPFLFISLPLRQRLSQAIVE